MEERRFQLFTQEGNGPFVPTDRFVTVMEWEQMSGRFEFCTQDGNLWNRDRYFAFRQVSETERLWLRAEGLDLLSNAS